MCIFSIFMNLNELYSEKNMYDFKKVVPIISETDSKNRTRTKVYLECLVNPCIQR